MTTPVPGACIDCGKPAMGTRCRKDYGRWEQEEFARLLAGQDAQMLAMRDVEKLSIQRIADRLGLSKPRVYAKLRDARRRELIRQAV